MSQVWDEMPSYSKEVPQVLCCCLCRREKQRRSAFYFRAYTSYPWTTENLIFPNLRKAYLPSPAAYVSSKQIRRLFLILSEQHEVIDIIYP